MSTVSGGLHGASLWVTFLDVVGRTRIALRANCKPVIGDPRAVFIENGTIGQFVFTRDTFEEIFS